MLNRIILLVLILNLQSLAAQKSTGEVIYSVFKIEESWSLNKEADYSNMSNKVDALTETIKYKLEFNSNESKFYMIKRMSVGEDYLSDVLTKHLFGEKKLYYANIEEKLLLQKEEIFDKTYLVKTSFDELEWTLTRESKNISNYVCFKAFGNRTFKARDNKIKSLTTIAWYCPELALPFGPFEAVGLPGMVLEFQTGSHGFIANKIIFKDQDQEIKRPIGKLIKRSDIETIYREKIDIIKN
jgi:GLPGLI family protein